MIRDLKITPDSKIYKALGISDKRFDEIEELSLDALEVPGATVLSVIESLNKADLDDAEWTAVIFALGGYVRVARDIPFINPRGNHVN